MTFELAVRRVQQFCTEKKLIDETTHVILAVSGGRDSMTLLFLLHAFHPNLGAAHMNFGLRGAESDGDENLVRQVCAQLSVPLEVKKVKCQQYAESRGLSTEEAARNLRYNWFAELASEMNGIIATAHHRHDNLETVLINMIRGTGIQGMKGIPVNRTGIIRPLMAFNGDQVSSLAVTAEIPFREDSSNARDDYLRNEIRHHVLPVLSDRFPGVVDRVFKNSQRIADEVKLYELALHQHEIQFQVGELPWRIPIGRIKQLHTPVPILFSLIGPFGFDYATCRKCCTGSMQTGKRLLSGDYQVMIDRDDLILMRIPIMAHEESIQCQIGEVNIFGSIELKISEEPLPTEFAESPNHQFCSASIGSGDLRMRKWRAGDRIDLPNGAGSQKVKQLLTDRRIPSPEKPDVLVLTCDDEIVWVIGVKLNSRYYVQPGDVLCYQLSWQRANYN